MFFPFLPNVLLQMGLSPHASDIPFLLLGLFLCCYHIWDILLSRPFCHIPPKD